jgi:hypothetical protein
MNPISWGNSVDLGRFSENSKKGTPALVELPCKRDENDLFPAGNAPFRG